jgi:hypothetical protein
MADKMVDKTADTAGTDPIVIVKAASRCKSLVLHMEGTNDGRAKVGFNFLIRHAGSGPGDAEGLAELLLDVVEGGASVGFMYPLTPAKAFAFWENVLASAERGERILIVAEDAESKKIIGTVQVALAMPENQPHRADVAKMQVLRTARRHGVGAALMRGRAKRDASRTAREKKGS